MFHAYIRRKKKGYMSVVPLRLACGQLVHRPRHVAKLFADTFASVFVHNGPVRPAPYQNNGGKMHDLNITVEKVYAALQCLIVSLAVGPDNLHPRVLKLCALQLSVTLTMIFRNSFETGPLPKVWLESIVGAIT